MSEQPAPDLHDLIRRVVVQLFPWAAYLYTDASRDFTIRSASTKIHLGGDAQDPPVARKGDACGYEYVQVVIAGGVVTAVVVSRSDGTGAASVWSPVASGVLPPVDGVTAGTPITIIAGSARVTCK